MLCACATATTFGSRTFRRSSRSKPRRTSTPFTWQSYSGVLTKTQRTATLGAPSRPVSRPRTEAMQHVTINGASIEYHEQGRGEPHMWPEERPSELAAHVERFLRSVTLARRLSS